MLRAKHQPEAPAALCSERRACTSSESHRKMHLASFLNLTKNLNLFWPAPLFCFVLKIFSGVFLSFIGQNSGRGTGKRGSSLCSEHGANALPAELLGRPRPSPLFAGLSHFPWKTRLGGVVRMCGKITGTNLNDLSQVCRARATNKAQSVLTAWASLCSGHLPTD